MCAIIYPSRDRKRKLIGLSKNLVRYTNDIYFAIKIQLMSNGIFFLVKLLNWDIFAFAFVPWNEDPIVFFKYFYTRNRVSVWELRNNILSNNSVLKRSPDI